MDGSEPATKYASSRDEMRCGSGKRSAAKVGLGFACLGALVVAACGTDDPHPSGSAGSAHAGTAGAELAGGGRGAHAGHTGENGGADAEVAGEGGVTAGATGTGGHARGGAHASSGADARGHQSSGGSARGGKQGRGGSSGTGASSLGGLAGEGEGGGGAGDDAAGVGGEAGHAGMNAEGSGVGGVGGGGVGGGGVGGGGVGGGGVGGVGGVAGSVSGAAGAGAISGAGGSVTVDPGPRDLENTRECCRGGTQTLGENGWGACEGPFISAETCNGIDDDCNGEVDELGTITCGIGACATTIPACTSGAVSACIPAAPSAEPDGCDGVDTDCDGAVDEDCSACWHVAPDGNDSVAIANDGTTAFASVQGALDFADTHRDVATRVCVASGPDCGATATFAGPTGSDLTMHDGLELLGGYESTAWKRCATPSTTLAPQTNRGLVFPASVTTQTVVDGFSILRLADATATTAVTVDGARGALLSNVTIPNGPDSLRSYAVNVINGARATVFRSRIEAGTADTFGAELVGVRAVGAEVLLEDNCATPPDPVSGRCTSDCSASGPGIVLSRVPPMGSTNAERVNAVLLDHAMGSRIERSSVCTVENLWGSLANELAAIDVEGDADGLVIRGNSILAQPSSGPYLPYFPEPAVALGDCADRTPWIVDNSSIVVANSVVGEGSGFEAIHAEGACHPVIESNGLIAVDLVVGGSISAASGVHCSAGARCVVSRNEEIRVTFAPSQGVPTLTGSGVACDTQSCSRIDDNRISGLDYDGFYSRSSAYIATGFGISFAGGSSALIANNDVVGVKHSTLCWTSGTGVSIGPGARLENNRILGVQSIVTCDNASPAQGAYGVAASGNVEVTSNRVEAAPYCVVFSDFPTPSSVFPPAGLSIRSSGGIFRNNIFIGSCADAVGETGAAADPLIFARNALSPVRYRDERYTVLTSIGDIEALADMSASGNLDSDCAPASDGHLELGSPCINAGTAAGAPWRDQDGDVRDALPDIGPDEYVP